jgi:FkbM family methyltransferase
LDNAALGAFREGEKVSATDRPADEGHPLSVSASTRFHSESCLEIKTQKSIIAKICETGIGGFNMNTELFTGKANVYAKARPGYPEAAMDWIASLLPKDAVIADVGAGTGKFTVLLAQKGYRVYAVEPNADMRRQLYEVLSPYPNTTIVDGSAESTTLSDHSVDAITCAQALHWFDPSTFRTECSRIAKGNALVITVYNNTPGGSSISHSKLSTDSFYENSTVQEFPNPVHYSRESWLAYMTSHSHDPLPTDSRYAAHIREMNAIFDREQLNGLLRRDVVTTVYSEVLR